MQNYSVYTRLRFHKKYYNFHFLHKSFVGYKNTL